VVIGAYPAWRTAEQPPDPLEAFRTILVPLDGTPSAERVLPYAELLVRETGGELVLLRVAPTSTPSVAAIGLPVPDGIDLGVATDDARREAASYLNLIKRTLAGRGVRVTTFAIAGVPDEEIIRRAQASRTDLIAMTTNARGGLRRVIYGSVADSVVQHAPCPVFLVPVPRDERRAGTRPWVL
jgi:nucleotide-binding universal stress UspA family protein